ncbi:DNA-directed DNA polymerase alpha subunit pol12 [Tilletia horrida]|nr:DNA-directed DNA polymerase alpha subunit pol12 [Tilletia horrida]
MPTATTTMNADTRAALATHFGKSVLNDDDLLFELSSTLRLYAISAKTLFYKYESFAIENDIPPGTPLTLDTLRELKTAIQKERAAQGFAPPPTTAAFATPARPSGSAGAGTGTIMRSGVKTSLGNMLGSATPGARQGVVPTTPFSKGPAGAGNGLSMRPGQSASGGRSAAFQTPSRASHGVDILGMDGLEYEFSSSAPGQAQLLETLNPQIELKKSRLGQSGRVKLAVSVDPRLWDYRYMFEKPSDKGEALDDRIDALAQLIIDHYGLEEDLGDPAQQTQENVYVVGRICPEAAVTFTNGGGPSFPKPDDDAEMADGEKKLSQQKGPLSLADAIAVDAAVAPTSGSSSRTKQNGGTYPLLPRLTPQGVLLETSRVLGAGSRTRLVFSPNCIARGAPPGAAGTVGLFPGMIVGCKGRNVGGESFRVEEVLLIPSLPHSITPVRSMLQYQHEEPKWLMGDSARMLIVSGPYVDLHNSNDLDFGPWHRLMDWIEQGSVSDDTSAEAPGRFDVVLLLGPFVPANHPALLSPSLSGMPAELFARHISGRLDRLAKSTPGTSVILVPSTNDVCNRHAAWPQPSFEKGDEELGLSKRVKRLPNPALFTINEVTIAVSTADVLRDLKAEELVQRMHDPAAASTNPSTAAPKDQVARLIRHVVGQRSFYPLYPSSPASALPLDVTHSNLAVFPSVTPDVLILPSTLKAFARIIDSTVVVNPGIITPATAAASSDKPKVEGKEAQQPITVARIVVAPLAREELERLENEKPVGDDLGQDGEPHRIYERARVDLLQI